MKRSIRRVADLLGAYALKQGLCLADIDLYYRADTHWGKIDFILITDAFEGRDEYECYASVKEYLRRRLEDDPQLFSRIGLVIETPGQVAEGGLYAIGDDYQRARPRDLVIRTLNEVGRLLTAIAVDRNWNKEDFKILFKRESASDKLQVVLRRNDPEPAIAELRANIETFLKSRLSDEPDVLTTLDLEVAGVEEQQPHDLKEWFDSSSLGNVSHSLT